MKGQAALEYLMTYGWVILVLVVVIGALYALGLTKPCRWTGTQVREFPDFSVENVKVNTTTLGFDVNYVKPGSVTLQRVVVEGDAAGTYTPPTAINLPPATRVNVNLTTMTKAKGDCFNFDVFITYNISVAGGYELFNSTGKISGVVG